MSENLIARRKELLRRRLLESGLNAQSTSTIATRSPGERSPLSAGQQRLWFVQTRNPKDTTLNVGVAFRLTGSLDTARLRAAVAAVVGRHEILRTSYGVDETATPYQFAAAEVDVPWNEHDLTEMGEQTRERRVEVLARREFGRPFDLANDPLLRISLVRTAIDEWAFIFVVHHICWDDDSWEVFFTEVSAEYNSPTGADTAAARPQFVDVAARATDRDDEDAVAYWREKLLPAPEWLELPAEKSGPASKSAGRCRLEIPIVLMAAVNAFARDRAATPFSILLAGFGALIHRYTRADDFLVAVPIVDRRGADAASLIGYFGNSLLLRSRIDGAGSFADLVSATRDAALGGFAHQHIGLDRVVRELNPDRMGGDGLEQLVRLSFYTRRNADHFRLVGVATEQLDLAAAVTDMPLGVTVVLDDAAPSVEAEYFTDLLDGPLVEEMLVAYVQLLGAALASPTARLCDLDILGSRRSDVLRRSVGIQEQPVALTLPELFESRVDAHPDKPAVADDQRTLSYREINERANRLAHWFIDRGAGAEKIVALKFSASLEFVVAAFAVLKAGAAYLPIDPSYPDDRVDYMIADAAPVLVLDSRDLAAAELEAVGLSHDNPLDGDRILPLRLSSLAYVIYTSGSTGKPKGVSVSHGAIADHLGYHEQVGLAVDDRLVQTSSVSFDASMLEVFCTLTIGATLVIPKPDALQDIAYMADLLVRQRVTVMHMVPSMLSMFLLLPGVKEWTTLRHIPVGGEALSGEVADKFTTVFDATLGNNYGPTEAVVAATHYRVAGPQGARVVPIGIPNRNVSIYLLDSALQLIPDGVVGEIYIGGEQLARGYLGRAGLTAERFVADPMRPGGRLYRTGDLARRNGDGDIEFIGRADEQVKIRGFRIELGEVEAVLSGHPNVARALVIVAEDPNIGPSLAAYLVADRDVEVDIGDVREHAAQGLPEYMVPSAFAVIDEIPLTTHGKLDRRALPDPVNAAPREFRAPATPTEIRVAALFTQLFGRERIGADDSFFELGGHSLMAARLVTQIRTEFGVDIDVRAPFDTPTVAGLATWLVAQVSEEFGIDLDAQDDEDYDVLVESGRAATDRRPEITKRTRPERLPLSYSQVAMWFTRRFEGPSAVGNIPMAVRIDGPLDVDSLTAAVGDVIARHEALRTTFPEVDGIPYQVVGPVARATLPVTVIESVAGADAHTLLAEALDEVAQYVFAVESEPLVRPHLFTVAPDHHVLSLLVHHMVIDHWSFGVLLADLVTAYRHRSDFGSAPQWPPHGIDYGDYALWQRDLFDVEGNFRDAGNAQVEYWRRSLAGLPDEIVVATDRPRPAVLSKAGEVVDFVVPPALRTRLRGLADSLGVSEFMLLQSVIATLLHKLGAGDDIAIGTPIAGRVDDVTADLVGLFANMVILRNDFTGNPTLREILIRGRNVALGAYANQDVPIERLVEALNPRRSRSRNPLFQVMMHFRDGHSAPDTQNLTESGATTLALLPVEFETSFLDLNIIFVAESDGGLRTRLVAAADLYDRVTAELLAERILALLTVFADDSDRPIDRVDILTEAERIRVVEEWSTTPAADIVTESHTSEPAEPVRLIVLPPGHPAIDAELAAGRADCATVIVATDAQRGDPAAVAALIVEHSVQRVIAEPALLAQLPHSGISIMPSVRTWVSASPVAPLSLAEVLSALSAGSRSRYLYAVADLGKVVVEGDLSGDRPGRPVPGRRILILDGAQAPSPQGVLGDVYVDAGQLDSDHRVPDPLSPGRFLLRTGDRARWNNSGCVVFDMGVPDAVVAGVGGGAEPPRTPTERVLCEVLAELLEIDDVGRDDNFFALGGDSVISIQMSTRVAIDGLPLTPQMIFDCHTISDLAAAVDNAQTDDIGTPGEATSVEAIATTHAMSASGLSGEALAALTASWQAGA